MKHLDLKYNYFLKKNKNRINKKRKSKKMSNSRKSSKSKRRNN